MSFSDSTDLQHSAICLLMSISPTIVAGVCHGVIHVSLESLQFSRFDFSWYRINETYGIDKQDTPALDAAFSTYWLFSVLLRPSSTTNW